MNCGTRRCASATYTREWADKLADAIEEHFGEAIGEHSNQNCPWSNALEIICRADSRPAGGVADVCKVCNGTRLVDDGEIDCYPNGEPFMSGPVKCVKDCPACATLAASAALPATESFEAYWQVAQSIPRTQKDHALHAWNASLSASAAQPGAEPVLQEFNREDLEGVADGLDTYEKTVNVGNNTGLGDEHLESTTAYAARFIRAYLAAAPTNDKG